MPERTTIRMDAGLLAEAKLLAVRTGRTLTRVIEDAVREALARPRRPRRQAVNLPVSRCRGGLLPGVDLDSNAGLLDRMEAGDGSF